MEALIEAISFQDYSAPMAPDFQYRGLARIFISRRHSKRWNFYVSGATARGLNMVQ
jgi:hypothetical protein